MNKKKRFGIVVALAISVLPLAAMATTTSVTTTQVNLRAGPATNYPVVVSMPAQASLVTYGCLPDMSWCDVGFAGQRGWVSSTYVRVVYRQETVVVTTSSAPVLGIGIAVFDYGYWQRYYPGRPWYGSWSVYAAPRPVGVVHQGVTACNGNGCIHGGRTYVAPRPVQVDRVTVRRW